MRDLEIFVFRIVRFFVMCFLCDFLNRRGRKDFRISVRNFV